MLAAESIVPCLKGNKTHCKSAKKYETVRGCTTSKSMLSTANGWFGRTFETWGFEE